MQSAVCPGLLHAFCRRSPYLGQILHTGVAKAPMCNAGMKAAKKRGKHVGRPKALSPGQVQQMRELLAAGKTQREVTELLGVSANTVGRTIKYR